MFGIYYILVLQLYKQASLALMFIYCIKLKELVNSCLQVKHMHITTQVNTMIGAHC